MDSERATPPAPTPSEDSVPAKAEKNFRPLWLAVAALALVATFLFQWKNSIDQASIAETADGRVLRARVEEGPAFRIFSSDKNRPVREAFLCGSDGEILARLVPANGVDGLFCLPSGGDASDADFSPEKLRREGRFLHLVLPAEKTDAGQPVVLLVQNPFKDAGEPAKKP